MRPQSNLVLAAALGLLSPLVVSFFFFHPVQTVPSPSPVKANSNIEPTVTSTPTLIPQPTATPTSTALKTYKDIDYNYKISFPASWQGSLNEQTSLGLEVYTIVSPSKSDSVEILVSDGIWADVKLEIGAGSQKTSFAGVSALVRKTSKNTIYVFPSKSGNKIFRLTVTGSSTLLPKILNSFKFI